MKKVSKPFNLIILGDPGAGKATQAKYFCKKYHLYDFDMGVELFLARKHNKDIDQALKDTVDQGNLAPTKIVREIYRNKLKSVFNKTGILFDGTPRMVGEAKMLRGLLKENKSFPTMVLFLKITPQEAIKRIAKRRGYGGKARADDRIQALQNRFKYYREKVTVTTEYFQKHYFFESINAKGSILEVRAKIQKAIDKYLKTLD